MSGKKDQSVPPQVLELLATSEIGYLSVTSSKGELFSYPVAFYFSNDKVYFMTPISSAKLKFMRGNPTVSFLVDNHLLTKGAVGAMIQGRAKVFSIMRMVMSILSVGPKIAKYAAKYPGYFTFYASGKELPDERKLYKYRLIRIDADKIIFWRGYEFGKVRPKSRSGDPLAEADEEERIDRLAQLMKYADEELPVAPSGGVEAGNEVWLQKLDTATENGVLSREENSVIASYRGFLRRAVLSNQEEAAVSEEEKKLLARWKKSKNG